MCRAPIVGSFLCLIMVACVCRAAEPDKPAVSATDLLQPDMFPNASFGMAVESVDDGTTARVVTTGSVFLIDKSTDTIECQQRIAKARPVAMLKFQDDVLSGLNLTHRKPGAAIFSGGGTTVRINSDSLLMVSPGKDGDVTAELTFTPDYYVGYRGNYNFFDPHGGISFFEHGQHPISQMHAASDPVTVVWPWRAGDVFWAGVSPPKPFNWEASIRTRVAWGGSSVDRYMYPSDALLLQLHRESVNTVYLQTK